MKDYQMENESPIAVLDSGVGGISVLRELIKIMPNEDYIYYGDSKNVPYGTKSKEEVRALTIRCAERLFVCSGKCIRIFRLWGLSRRSSRQRFAWSIQRCL